MKKVITMCDPPSGWKWGFPKAMPSDLTGEAFDEWLVSEGMPQSEIDYWNNSQLGYMPVRSWTEEIEE
jgi:hypothetical protein